MARHQGPTPIKDTGEYLGPLPAYCSHKHRPLRGRLSYGKKRTALKAAYPSEMNKRMKRALVIYRYPLQVGGLERTAR